MKRYKINYESIPHGVISWRHDGSDSVYCEAGEEVRITWQPNAGWGLSEAHYTDANGNEVDIDTKEMAFIMPESDITIGGTFKRFSVDDWEGYEGGGGGTTDYNNLENKPKINGTTLEGDVEIPTGATLEVEAQNFVQATLMDGDNQLEIYPVGDEVSLKFEKETQQRIVRLATTDYVNGKVMKRVVVGEENKIGEWVEGGVTYDLFEKTVDCGALTNATQKTVEHGLTNFVRLVGMEGIAVGPSNILPLPTVTIDPTKGVYLACGARNITITPGSDRSAFNAWVTLRFIREQQQ